jgi:acyl-homoserine lactone acylase PvdQ
MNLNFLKSASIALIACTACLAADPPSWQQHARNTTITRDNWGIAHIHGKTDADAVFGAIYAQAEDDFNRVETNYLVSLGRQAEAEGESKIFDDLRSRLYMEPAELKKLYATCPDWLKKLMDAWADGLNFYLAKHPAVHPKAIRQFEPWMALSFTEGSIGGDIEKVNIRQLEAFYGNPMAYVSRPVDPSVPEEPRGSNGAAIAPGNTTGRHALLLINPHTTFFFRSELQMTSDEGLNAYGASTWGQFFIYQGFNEKAGWMHTSSGVDAIDEFLETVEKRGSGYVYKFGSEWRPVTSKVVTVAYKTAGGMAERKFTVYRTHHGPIIRQEGGKWVAFKIMDEPVKALTQSYTRTKARDYKAFRQTMELKADSSNNTIYADADGTIAYFHGNFIPRRDTKFDFTKPVDGSDPATDWKGLLAVDEAPNLLNPASGWLYNANNWPWSAAGPSSKRKEDYPAYVEKGGETARGLHAVKVLENRKDFTLEGLLAAAYDSYLTWFDKPLPALLRAWDAAAAGDPRKARVAEQVAVLKAWDQRWGVGSVATSLGVFWADHMQRSMAGEARAAGLSNEEFLAKKATPAQLLDGLAAASDKLQADFGTWKTPWGEINRFQRLTGDIQQPFSDAGPSIPVGFTSAV